jgi:hypothetical protein
MNAILATVANGRQVIVDISREASIKIDISFHLLLNTLTAKSVLVGTQKSTWKAFG